MADLSIYSAIGQLTALKAALSKIQEWMTSDLENVPLHYQLIMDLSVSIDCCQMLMKPMEEEMARIVLDEKGKPTSGQRVKMLLQGEPYRIFKECIGRQTDALTLLLTACNWCVIIIRTATVLIGWTARHFPLKVK